jgi:hypothetical protein
MEKFFVISKSTKKYNKSFNPSAKFLSMYTLPYLGVSLQGKHYHSIRVGMETGWDLLCLLERRGETTTTHG